MIYIPNSSTDAAYSLAVEEFLLTRVTSGDLLMLWQNTPTVVIGKFQNAYGEVSVETLLRRGITLVRRNSGGGTVYHDEGNLNFTMISDRGETSADYARFLTPVIEALRGLGIPAKMGDAFDITVDGKKVSGNAQSVVKNRVLHHGTLLFDSNLSVVDEITGHETAGVTSRAIRSNPSPVGNLRPFLARDMDFAAFRHSMKTALCGDAPETYSFTDEERREIQRLYDTKYRTWEWNYGRSPAFTRDCGTFSVDVKDGIITAVHGDDRFAALLTGCRMRPDDLPEPIPERERIIHVLFR